MLTFSQGLILFSVSLTSVFLIMFILSQRVKIKPEKSLLQRKQDIALVLLLILESSTILLLQLSSFKSSWAYLILLPIIAGILICSLRWMSDLSKNRRLLILFSVILYHVAILYFSPLGIAIGERTSSMASLTINGHWDTNWQFLNPTYNPFPMDISLFSTLSMVTNIPYISQLFSWVFYLPFIIAFDLILYILTKRVTSSEVAGIFAIFILASLPTTNLLFNTPRWAGSLLVLISTLALIKASKKSVPYAYLIIANLTYVAAILFHPSAAIGTFFPLGIVIFGYVGTHFIKRDGESKLFRNPLFLSASALLIVITLTRAIYTAGYSEVIFPGLNAFVTGIFSNISPSEFSIVYENTVNPVNAYAWSVPLALSTALAIYALLKKRCVGGIFTLILYAVGAFFTVMGFLSTLFGLGSFHETMYAAFIFFIPAASIIAVKILKSSIALATIFLIFLVFFTSIALTDPMLSPERYRTIGAQNILPNMDDYNEAYFLVNVVPSNVSFFCPYEIASLFSYMDVIEGNSNHDYYITGADTLRAEIKRVTQDGELLSNVIYMWSPRWESDIKSQLANLSVNVFYDSDRYVIFESSQKIENGELDV